MKKWIVKLGVLLVVVLGAVQFIPVAKTNPPVEADVATSPDIKAVLRRACYNCHSHETVWPWYSRVAPVSWFVAGDVGEGRREVNFSLWNRYDAAGRAKELQKIRKQIEKGEMPPWYYTALHPEAKLLPSDRQLILRWAGGMNEPRAAGRTVRRRDGAIS